MWQNIISKKRTEVKTNFFKQANVGKTGSYIIRKFRTCLLPNEVELTLVRRLLYGDTESPKVMSWQHSISSLGLIKQQKQQAESKKNLVKRRIQTDKAQQERLSSKKNTTWDDWLEEIEQDFSYFMITEPLN